MILNSCTVCYNYFACVGVMFWNISVITLTFMNGM